LAPQPNRPGLADGLWNDSRSIRTEVFAPFRRILGVMPSRMARWFAFALVVFLFAQPIPFLAFAADSSDASCCCKGKSASCCRRSHGHAAHGDTSGPALSSRECCGQCQVSVRNTQPVAESIDPTAACVELAPTPASPATVMCWIPSARHDAALFERPPPSAVQTLS